MTYPWPYTLPPTFPHQPQPIQPQWIPFPPQPHPQTPVTLIAHTPPTAPLPDAYPMPATFPPFLPHQSHMHSYPLRQSQPPHPHMQLQHYILSHTASPGHHIAHRPTHPPQQQPHIQYPTMPSPTTDQRTPHMIAAAPTHAAPTLTSTPPHTTPQHPSTADLTAPATTAPIRQSTRARRPTPSVVFS